MSVRFFTSVLVGLLALALAGCAAEPGERVAAPLSPATDLGAAPGRVEPDAYEIEARYAKARPVPRPEPLSFAERIEVRKAARRLLLWRNGEVLRAYEIALGRDPLGPKREEGDGRTPEGSYLIDYANPASEFYRSLRVSYPDEGDRAQARARGVSPGGGIFIHGEGVPFGPGARSGDWTEGCIAVDNGAIEEIFRLVPIGTPIDIYP